MQGSARIDELRQKFHENPRRYFAPLANEYRKAGDPEQAIAICRAHLAQQPGHMSGHVVYAQALYDAKRVDEARTVFEKALSLDPDNAIVLRHLGDIARERGETVEARHWYARALDADPQDVEIAAYVAELTEPVTEPAAEAVEAPAAEREVAPAALPEEEAAADAVSSDGMVSEGGPPAREAGAVEPEPEGVEREGEAVEREAEPAGEAGVAEYVAAEPAFDPESRFVTSEFPALDEKAAPEKEPAVEPAARGADEGVVSAAVEFAPAVEPDVLWRKTPPHEESPFVTRTMAELYARQGYRAAALDVYRQLALNHPNDQEILGRIEELAAEESPAPQGPAAPGTTAAPDIPVTAEAYSGTPLPAEALPLELSDNVVYAPSSEDLNLEPDVEAPPLAADRHFTELELAAGDSWDTDAWGAGFSIDEKLDLEFHAPDSVIEGPEAVPASDVLAEHEEPVPEEAPVPETAAPEPGEEAAFEEPAFEEPAFEEPAAEETAAAEPMETAAAAGETEAEEQPHLVAYSPQAPDQEEITRYVPHGPTVREFFATLGAKRPRDRGVSVDFPLATDAFASLFADSTVSEEDTRAAFALSGALSGEGPGDSPSLTRDALRESAATPSPSPSEAPADAAQESEEDIRRFREWLDGLAES